MHRCGHYRRHPAQRRLRILPRTIVGVLILASLSSDLVHLGVAAYWQGMVKGAVIILAVAVDVIFNKLN